MNKTRIKRDFLSLKIHIMNIKILSNWFCRASVFELKKIGFTFKLLIIQIKVRIRRLFFLMLHMLFVKISTLIIINKYIYYNICICILLKCLCLLSMWTISYIHILYNLCEYNVSEDTDFKLSTGHFVFKQQI